MASSESKLVPLNFTNYEKFSRKKLLDTGVYLTELDHSKVPLKRSEFDSDNFEILYDGKPFRLYLKAFTGVVKRSKYLKRSKHIKVKDPMISSLLWDLFHTIQNLVRNEISKQERFCWFMEPYRIWLHCDEGLAPMHLYCFEEAAVAFGCD